ncbi:hypothetical protein BCR39DRAFT_511435 [Naematelia encephala]|uniref:Uncharacterized protein n=1 Tax=Naematelia encephala TaxID=71784 RepID=A0A1Y2BLN3_9TREE|nr:hypothetical protein BCR39DRAFT_511435 [Naematelia encephala]
MPDTPNPIEDSKADTRKGSHASVSNTSAASEDHDHQDTDEDRELDVTAFQALCMSYLPPIERTMRSLVEAETGGESEHVIGIETAC